MIADNLYPDWAGQHFAIPAWFSRYGLGKLGRLKAELFQSAKNLEQLDADGMSNLAPIIVLFGANPSEIRAKIGGEKWKILHKSTQRANVDRLVLCRIAGWTIEEALTFPEKSQRRAKYFLDYYIKSNASSTTSPLNQDPSEPQLQEYGQLFCDVLNPIYEQKESKMKWFIRGYNTEGSLTMYVFCYGTPKNDILPSIFDKGLKGIESLIYNQTQRNVLVNRVLREYLNIEGYDVLILIKPKFLRYWLKSIALRDADETFSDLKISGF